jgi:hypothetical protein
MEVLRNMKNSLTSMVLIVIIIILSLMTACAPEVLTGNSISGHVYDKQDGKPVKNALVEVEQTGTQPAPGITVKPGEPTPILPLANPHRAKTRTSSGGS